MASRPVLERLQHRARPFGSAMATTSHLLLEVFPIAATLLQDGDRTTLGEGLRLSVLMLEAPTAPNEPPGYGAQEAGGSETWLGLRIGDLLDVPLGRSSKIVFNQPSGYTIPAAGAASRGKQDQTVASGFVKIELGRGVSAEDKEALDSILSSWTTSTSVNETRQSPPASSSQDSLASSSTSVCFIAPLARSCADVPTTIAGSSHSSRPTSPRR